MNTNSKIFSFNRKVGLTFDVSRQKSNCINSCFAAKWCYNEFGQEKINHQYQLKLNRNFNLLSSKRRFVRIVKKELHRLNYPQLRLFSNGDIIYNNTELAQIQLKNIFDLCNSVDSKFWMVTRNQNELFKFMSLGNTKPDNLNILLSVKNESVITPGFNNFCKSLKVQLCYITDKKSKSNCKASTSKNKHSCFLNGCNDCITYDDNPRIWFIHSLGKSKFLESLQ